MAKDGTFKYGGRDNAPDPLFLAGKSAISFNSSAYRGISGEERQIRLAPRRSCPTIPTIIKQPINSIIGGASLWAMTAPNRTAAEYKARGAVPEIHRPAEGRMPPGPRTPATFR